MAKRTQNMIEELAHALSGGRRSPDDYFEKVIDATVGHDRMLVAPYSLLAAGTVFLLFQAEMSPWAGAALAASGALFLAGVAHAHRELPQDAPLGRCPVDWLCKAQ